MKRIFVVDDEADIRTLLAEKLKKNNFDAIPVANGEELLVLAKKNPPDLILMDVAMAGLDGFQTCQRLREERNTAQVPVLFLTAKDLDAKGLEKRISELNASGYLPKPSTFAELLEKINEILG